MGAIPLANLILAVLQLLLQAACIILAPMFVIKLICKELPYAGAFVAGWLTVLLPVLTYLNNSAATDALWQSFFGWGVENLELFIHLSRGVGCAEVAASVFAGVLLCTSRRISDRNSIILFIFLSLVLHLIAQVLLPLCFFGDFGLEMAREETILIAFYAVMTFSFMLFVARSSFSRTWFGRVSN